MSRQPYVPDCWRCLDVGVVHVSMDGFDGYAICDTFLPDRRQKCGVGQRQSWKLPKTSECPGGMFRELDWRAFKPNALVTGGIEQKIAWWRETVRLAEQLWIEFLSQQP